MRNACGRLVVRVVAAAIALMAMAHAARGGDKSLIAGLTTGDEIRYTYTARNEETAGITGKPGFGAHSVSTETVGLLVRCKADTVALRIIEVVIESFRVTLESPMGKADVDLGGPPPAESEPAIARELYKSMHPIVGLTLTLNTAPGSGDITQFSGGEALLKSSGASLLRRYLERDYFTATFGPIFQLKSNSAAPPPGQEWWMQRHIFAYAHGGKSSVWETRVVETVVADISTIKGKTRAIGNPEGSEKAAVFFKSITGEVVYKWDMARSRLLSATRTESIASRFDTNGMLRESDVITKSTLEMVLPGAKASDKPAGKPVEKPAELPAKKQVAPSDASSAGGSNGKAKP